MVMVMRLLWKKQEKWKRLWIFLVLFFCLTCCFFSFQISGAEENMAIPIRLEINGEMVARGAQIISGRSMVPLKTVTDSFGIPVLWFDSSRIIRIDDVSGSIFLKIGDSKANIDGRIIQLDVPPMLEGGQTLVPLRFIAEALRAEIEWFPEEKLIKLKHSTLKNVTYESYENLIRVIFDITVPEKYEIFRLFEPERLVLDFPGVMFSQKQKLITAHHDLLRSIRVSQFRENPLVSRAVLDLSSGSLDYQIYSLSTQHKLIIDIFPQGLVNEDGENFPLIPLPEMSILYNKIIVIDPGHGGKNAGAIGSGGTRECEVNYDISQRLIKLLKKAGAYTIMTRNEDEDLGLYERAALSNNYRADLFISIHADAHPKSETRGSTMYAHYNATKENWALAWYVHEELIKNTGLASKGLRAADFVVLRETNALSILVETAYLTNKEDEKLLNHPEFRQKVAEGILNGVIRYYTKQND